MVLLINNSLSLGDIKETYEPSSNLEAQVQTNHILKSATLQLVLEFLTFTHQASRFGSLKWLKVYPFDPIGHLVQSLRCL